MLTSSNDWNLLLIRAKGENIFGDFFLWRSKTLECNDDAKEGLERESGHNLFNAWLYDVTLIRSVIVVTTVVVETRHMLLLLWLFLVFLLLLKVKEKAPVWEGKERDERQRLLLYSFVSTLHHHRLSLLSSLLTCKQQSLCFEGRNPHYSFPSLSDLRTVFFCGFQWVGGRGGHVKDTSCGLWSCLQHLHTLYMY